MFADAPSMLQPYMEADDKAQHFIAFAGVSFCFAAGRSLAFAAMSAFLLIFAGFALEPLQPLLTASREASLLDAAASGSGALCGAAAAAAIGVIGLGDFSQSRAGSAKLRDGEEERRPKQG